MGAAFVITLREAFEASLILGIVYAYLEKVGARDGFRFVTWGGTVGLLLSLYRESLLKLPEKIKRREGLFKVLTWR